MKQILNNKRGFFSILLTIFVCLGTKAQEKKVQAIQTDSITKQENSTMMLNATSSTGPREINIGLPAGVTGTAVNENGLPTAYVYWPIFPTNVWRLDASTVGIETLNLNETALKNGDVGVTFSTYDNLGTEKQQGNFAFNSNGYGLLNATGNLSGPINNKGLLYSAGFYLDYDPGTLDMPFQKYYSDKTQLFKGALTQKYNGGKSKISVMYKYMNSKALMDSSSPFYYRQDGKVDEIPGIEIGKASFYLNSGNIWFKDLDGSMVQENMFNNNKTRTHELYFMGDNDFGNNWKLNYTLKLAETKRSIVFSALLGDTDISGGYLYKDTDTEVKSDKGYLHMLMATPEMTIKTLSSVANLNKKMTDHNIDLGLMWQMYNPGTYYGKTSMFITDIQENPQMVYNPGTSNQGYTFDEYGNIESSYNASTEYYSGKERKLAFYATDKWDITPRLNVAYGARLEWQHNKGYYAPLYEQDGTPLATSARNADGTFSNNRSLYSHFDENYLNYAVNAEAVFKLTNSFGFLGGAGVSSQSPKLESYGGQYEMDPKQNVITTGSLGFYYNNPFVELVSKGTYIKKTNYVARLNFVMDNETVNDVVYYGIETMGWTSDFLFSPFYFADNSLKNFKLHFLLTMQAPKYKDYKVDPTFPSGNKLPQPYDYTDNTVTTVSKFLMEIDPSYSFSINRDLKANVWLSARYYSKQYANLPNNLFYAAHWETFGGVTLNYKNLELNTKFVNILNQKGVNGTIGGTDLYTQSDVDALFVNGNRPIYAASYIRPFTAEFGLKFRF